MTYPIVHSGLTLLLISEAALMAGLCLYIKIGFYKDFEDVHNVVESFNSGDHSPISPGVVKERFKFDDLARKIDTIFWFFIVGTILMLFRAAIFAVSASKSKSRYLKVIRMEVIESLTEIFETEDVENENGNMKSDHVR